MSIFDQSGQAVGKQVNVGHDPTGNTLDAKVGDQMRLRMIDFNNDLNGAIWAQDMDGKTYRDPSEEQQYGDDFNRLIVITESAYADMVRRMREAGISRI